MSADGYEAMTANQYRAAIEALGLSQVRAAKWLGVPGCSGQRHAAEGPPRGGACNKSRVM
jgi:hypothetical protein